MFRKKKSNNLDERQEKKLLQIEGGCFWGLYWMLAASMMIQMVMGCTKKELAGEFVCFMIISAILTIACLREGIWDRHLKADLSTNLKVSGIAAAVVAVFQATLWFSDSYEHYGIGQLIVVIVLPAVLTFTATLILLSLCMVLYRKRVQKMEMQEDQEND